MTRPRAGITRQYSDVRSEIESYQHTVKRLTSENKQLKTDLANQKAASMKEIRHLTALLNDLARRARITRQYLSQIEHGDREPSPEVLRRIVNALGVSLDAISNPVPKPEEVTS